MWSVLCEQEWLRQKNAAQRSFVTRAVRSRLRPFLVRVPPHPNTCRSAQRPCHPTSRFTEPSREGNKTRHKFHLEASCHGFVQQAY